MSEHMRAEMNRSRDSKDREGTVTELPDWLQLLDLTAHPEGGFFRETWRSDITIPPSALPPGYDGPRSAGTAILFALLPGQQSAWHTVRSAELWFFHTGGSLLLEVGENRGTAEQYVLGPDTAAGQHAQIVIPPGHWQRAATPRGDQPCLVSCVVVPGFDFADFTMPD